MESYKERHVTWLENFYDLIVAIIVFQLSRELVQNVTVYGFLSFVALLIPVIWPESNKAIDTTAVEKCSLI